MYKNIWLYSDIWTSPEIAFPVWLISGTLPPCHTGCSLRVAMLRFIKTGRNRCDAKEDAGLQKEWKMRCWQDGGRGDGKCWGSLVQSYTEPCCLHPMFPCQIRSTDLTFFSSAVVNRGALKHSAVVTLADSYQCAFRKMAVLLIFYTSLFTFQHKNQEFSCCAVLDEWFF